MNPISEIPEKTASGIRWVLTDIDDTLTKEGKLLPEAYAALWDLKKEGLPVIALPGGQPRGGICSPMSGP
ncbi:MAG: hypothetical protein LBR47_05845 [Spirochaetaceae bacterium]|jgi:predicted HAD superfamily phosphohydrolase YqeG|nr:hypothetical protein [Spirochaetaceae bacterium]